MMYGNQDLFGTHLFIKKTTYLSIKNTHFFTKICTKYWIISIIQSDNIYRKLVYKKLININYLLRLPNLKLQ